MKKVTKKNTKVIQVYNEQEAKEFLLEIFDKMQIRVEPDMPRHMFFDIDGKTVFELDYEHGYLWVSDSYIWVFLEVKYSMVYSETIELFIKNMVEDIFNWQQMIPKRDTLKYLILGVENSYWK